MRWLRIPFRKRSLQRVEYVALPSLASDVDGDHSCAAIDSPDSRSASPRDDQAGSVRYLNTSKAGCLLPFVTALFTLTLLPMMKWSASPAAEIVPSRILLRTVGDNTAGMGSVLQQFQRSVVLSLVLGAEAFAVESDVPRTAHGYDTVATLNTARTTTLKAEYSRICPLSRYLNETRYSQLTDRACGALQSADASLLQPEFDRLRDEFSLSSMDSCGVILNDHPWEWAPQLCPCTWKWTTYAFGFPTPRVVQGAKSVGLHIRWGDVHTEGWGEGFLERPERSIPMSTVNLVVGRLQECFGDLDVHLYMESHNETMLGRLLFPFQLFDDQDPVGDLLDLASSDIQIFAGSSYTMIAHQIGRGGLSLVPDFDTWPRYYNETGTNSVLTWGQITKEVPCSDVKRLWREGRDRGIAVSALETSPGRTFLDRMSSAG